MSLGKSLLLATLAASFTALLAVGWMLMPPAWMIPVVYGFLVLFAFVNVFVWCYWLRP